MKSFYLLIVAILIIGFTHCAGDAREKNKDIKNDNSRIINNLYTAKLCDFYLTDSPIIVTGTIKNHGSTSYVTALYEGLDNPTENLNISSKPNAIILNAAGYDQTKFGPIKDKSKLAQVSGINIVKPNAPPCLVIHGSCDYGIPISEAREFVDKMRTAGNFCEFKIIEGAGHVPWLNPPYSTEAYNAKQKFLKQIGYINN